jgi:hypothetical protein
MVTAVPGGAIGWASKSYAPLVPSHADILGCAGHGRSRLTVISACSKSSFHAHMGKLGSTPAIRAIKWFLNVRIARSALFLLCWCGGTRSIWMWCFCRCSVNAMEVSLSRQSLECWYISPLFIVHQGGAMSFEVALLAAVCHGECFDVIASLRVHDEYILVSFM